MCQLLSSVSLSPSLVSTMLVLDSQCTIPDLESDEMIVIATSASSHPSGVLITAAATLRAGPHTPHPLSTQFHII